MSSSNFESQALLGAQDTLVNTTHPTSDSVKLDGAQWVMTEGDARYSPIALLGEGGMGEVRLCHDARLGRDVAVKSLHARLMDQPDAIARFLREVRVQGQLEHPAIVPVYDLGIRENRETYFTMKRVRGLTLEQVLAGLRAEDPEITLRFSRRRLLTAFSNVCLAVDFAHSRGVLHRDLKPSNVMLGDFGEVYVLDWGIARVRGATDPARHDSSDDFANENATDIGAVLGTPGYMSPEQAEGNHDALDARTDVYALGATLFEMLTLSPLHDRPTPLARLESTLMGANARASVRAPQAAVPPELEALCVRATTTRPDDRLASARELSNAIEGYLDGDRDLARRRELADECATSAATALQELEQAREENPEQRASALKDVGRALAFDPTHDSARRVLVKLLTEPPKVPPPGAQRQIDAADREAARTTGWLSAVVFPAWGLFGIPFSSMGLRRLDLFLASLAAYVLAGLFGLYTALGGPRHRTSVLAVTLCCAVGATISAWLMSPFLFAPGGIIASTMAFMLFPWKRGRIPIMMLGVVASVLPALLQWWNVLPATFAFRDGMFQILPYALSLPPGATFYSLVAINGGAVIAGASVVVYYRVRISKIEERMHLYSWQLQQLVPRETPAMA